MSNPDAFGNRYAEYYDIIYQDKDYRGESAYIAQLVKRFHSGQSKPDVIDLSCGTGRHLAHLARMGYQVAGSDISADMIASAEQSACEQGLDIPYYNESLQTADRIGGKFNVALSLFASINYLIDINEIVAALRSVHSLLMPGGLFIFDFWNGNAVLRDYSPVRVKTMSRDQTIVLRISETSLDRLANVATVNFSFTVTENDRIVDKFTEEHLIRYHFPKDLKDILSLNGFDVIHACPFMHADSPLDEMDWNVTFVARKND